MSKESRAAYYRERAANHKRKAAKFEDQGKESRAAHYTHLAAKCERKAVSIEEGGCYIATAVYGDYNHPKVVVLREFRDEYLQTTMIGRIFVSAYYLIGPSLAQLTKKVPLLSKATKTMIDFVLK